MITTGVYSKKGTRVFEADDPNTNFNAHAEVQPLLFMGTSLSQFSNSSSSQTIGEEDILNSKKLKRSTSQPSGNDDNKVDEFFSSVIKDLQQTYAPILPRPAFILVCHMAPTIFSFLNAIKAIGDIVLIIPKGYHRESGKKIIRQLKDQKVINENNFLEPDTDNANEIKELVRTNGIEIIKKYVGGNYFIIIDIGGYFSRTLENMILNDDADELRNKFLGIVEDTRNGEKKYYEVMERLKTRLASPIKINQSKASNRLHSLARCALKDTEDYNVGKSIVAASESIIRRNANAMLSRMEVIGVIGFGKIGKSIANHLQQLNIKTIIVHDQDVLRQIEASSLGFKVVDRFTLIKKSNVIFSATGNKCLVGEDLAEMRDNVFIASCTSGEDEFDISFWKCISEHLNEINPGHGNIQKLKILNKNINLLDDGNAVNFVDGAVNGPYIYSVQAGLIASAISLMSKHDDIESNMTSLLGIKLKELPRLAMETIALKWLHFFENNYHTGVNPTASDLSLEIDCVAVQYEKVWDYLNEHGYLELDNEKLKKSIIVLKEILANESLSLPTIDNMLMHIRSLLKYGSHPCLMKYISEVLISRIGVQHKNQTNVHDSLSLIEIKLYLLKSTAVLYLNARNIDNCSKPGDLEGAIPEVDAKLSMLNIIPMCKLEDTNNLLKFLNLFLKTVDFFSKRGIQFKICVDKIKMFTKEFQSEVNKFKMNTTQANKEVTLQLG
ncbi:MAG: hypothetical protein K2P31_03260 [Rickettsiaceae bacterium]|nr:hypothetical protein [Rickettsiaceae bacterium]